MKMEHYWVANFILRHIRDDDANVFTVYLLTDSRDLRLHHDFASLLFLSTESSTVMHSDCALLCTLGFIPGDVPKITLQIVIRSL